MGGKFAERGADWGGDVDLNEVKDRKFVIKVQALGLHPRMYNIWITSLARRK